MLTVTAIKPNWWVGRVHCAAFFGTSYEEVSEKYWAWLREPVRPFAIAKPHVFVD